MSRSASDLRLDAWEKLADAGGYPGTGAVAMAQVYATLAVAVSLEEISTTLALIADRMPSGGAR
jgi:ribosomal protein RSM22 (predicted rRNA methylase)